MDWDTLDSEDYSFVDQDRDLSERRPSLNNLLTPKDKPINGKVADTSVFRDI